MITRVVLAKLSPTMEEGTIVRWSKNEGDAVKIGDVLAEIETDKANMEMEALGAGVLRKVLVPAGGKAPVGSLIGVIADPTDDIAATLAGAASTVPAAASAAAPAPAPPPPAPPLPAAGTAPAAVTLAPRTLPAATLAAAAPLVPPPATAVAPAPAPPGQTTPTAAGGRAKASPLARAIAAQRNIPIERVAGSGPGGRIVARDVESYAPAAAATAPAARAAMPATAPVVHPGQDLPLSSMRKTIAKRLSESAFGAPHFYVTVEIDMDGAVKLREDLLAAEAIKVSYNDLVLKACAKALRQVPMVNASWAGDTIAVHGNVHIGVAVSIPDGLITPVVRYADQKSIIEISSEVKDLALRARERKLKPEEFTGSTFTVSNLGMYDVTEFTAIINPPESAILAVGSVRKVPVVDGDRLRPGHRMKLTLSSDHRVIDGALAAQFLQAVRKLLEHPVSLLL